MRGYFYIFGLRLLAGCRRRIVWLEMMGKLRNKNRNQMISQLYRAQVSNCFTEKEVGIYIKKDNNKSNKFSFFFLNSWFIQFAWANGPPPLSWCVRSERGSSGVHNLATMTPPGCEALAFSFSDDQDIEWTDATDTTPWCCTSNFKLNFLKNIIKINGQESSHLYDS